MEEAKLSPAEALKANSRQLRGTFVEALKQDTTHFSKDDNLLLKFHGSYQQDDRDTRQKLLAEKKEPAYSLMIRSKIPGGKMSWEQYATHDELATNYGNGTLRITTRQGIQFHGILKKHAKDVVKGINEKLGTTSGACGDIVRNVMACPAPHHDRLKIRIFEYAKAVSDQFISRSGAYQEVWLDGENYDLPAPTPDGSEPVYGKTYLPRKFKIAFAFPDDNCIDVYTHDLGIVPEISKGELTGFTLLVGGGFGMTHGVATTFPRLATALCFVKPEELLDASKAVVLVQRDFGNRVDRKRARLKYLIAEKGIDWFRGEVEKRLGRTVEGPHPVHFRTIENHLGWHEQGAGKWYYGLYVENGRVKDAGDFRLKSGVRAAAEKFKPVIYLTAQQDILFSGLEESQKTEFEVFLKSYGIKLTEDYTVIRRDAMACPALPTCGLAISESERVMPALMDELEKRVASLSLQSERIMIRMTGCPNGCARPYNAEIAFVGRTVGTYAIFLGGDIAGARLNTMFADKVPQARIPDLVMSVLALFKKDRRQNENFGDFCARFGIQQLKAAIPV